MTPLAAKLVKRQLVKPSKREPFHDSASILPILSDFHCFEVTQAFEIAKALTEINVSALEYVDLVSQTAFLPADRTWIEWVSDTGNRNALYLVRRLGGFDVNAARDAGSYYAGTWETNKPLGKMRINRTETHVAEHCFAFALVFLAIINTPKIVGRRQHMPHAGLERKLSAALRPQGRYPLHAWTEIKLEITPPVDMSAQGIHEAHLTGKRALHFCRAHLRIQYGKLVYVKEHWRGDASLGIKRSRYVLKDTPRSAEMVP